jgi:hypothetical protein
MAASAAIEPGRWMDTLKDTVLQQPSREKSPFCSFGPLQGSTYRREDAFAAVRDAVEALAFSVSEARDRLRELVAGNFPETFSELVSYLERRLLRIETRQYGRARPTNYIVDEVTRQAVPAAQVDPRLSVGGISRLFGRSVAAEAALRAERLKSDPVYALSQKLRASLLPQLRAADGGPAFPSWDDLRFMLPAVLPGLEYSVQGERAYIGKAYGHASTDPVENLALLRRAKSDGVQLCVPAASRDDALAGRLIPGMPVLVRASAVPAEMIDVSLSHTFLSRAYGESLSKHFGAMARQAAAFVAPGVPGLDNVVSIAEYRAADFLQKFRRPEPQPQQAAKPTIDPKTTVIRSELDSSGKERMTVWDTRQNVALAADVRALPAGTYPKEDCFGMDLGAVAVGPDGALTHLDLDGNQHNPWGPSFEAAPERQAALPAPVPGVLRTGARAQSKDGKQQ